LSDGDPAYYSSGLIIAAADGTAVDVICAEDMSANTDNYDADLLIPGSIWQCTVSSQTLVRGTPVAMAGTSNVDGGTAADPAIGRVVNADVASTDTVAEIEILGEASAIA